MIGAIVYFHSGTSSLSHCKPVTARVCIGAGLQTTLREACAYTTSNAGLTGMRAATTMISLSWSLSRVLTRCQMLEILRHFIWIISVKVLRTLWGFTLLFPFFKGRPFSLQRFSWLTQRLAAEQGRAGAPSLVVCSQLHPLRVQCTLNHTLRWVLPTPASSGSCHNTVGRRNMSGRVVWKKYHTTANV